MTVEAALINLNHLTIERETNQDFRPSYHISQASASFPFHNGFFKVHRFMHTYEHQHHDLLYETSSNRNASHAYAHAPPFSASRDHIITTTSPRQECLHPLP